MKEAIKNGTTGYLVEPNPCHFALAMHRYIYRKKTAILMGNLAQLEFLGKYTLMAYGNGLRKLITSTEKSADPESSLT